LLSVCVVDLGLIGMWIGSRPLASVLNRFPLGFLSFRVDDPPNLIYLFAICIVIFLRFNRVSHQQARNAAELDAARELQQRLVPLKLPAVPGYRMEAAYLPAQEVGGDFYQVLEQRDGSTLVLVGDVSGKGLKAAMNGVLAIGAARTLASEQLSPGMLLKRLNDEMFGSQDGGFITCLCAHITRDGIVTFANAGHLAPYRNGEEIDLVSGLPLGIAAAVEYPETMVKIELGESLTLLSDGVVEARNAAGELFGFERTRAISTESAEKVAQAAQAFGQEDDITVLSLTVVPA
jgi:serine phosphatase RsbU (regulator of sigma subunit)